MARGNSSGGSVIRYILDRLQVLEDKERVVVEHLPMSDREVRESVKRNLADLLNSRIYFYPVHEDPLLAQSTFACGIPDYLGLGIGIDESSRQFKAIVERTVSWYEPRLTGVNVDLSFHSQYADRQIFLKVSGNLVLDNKTERVIYETAVEPESNAVKVE